MTRYASMDTLRKSISPDVMVVDDAAYLRPDRSETFAELRNAGALGVDVPGAPDLVSQYIVLPLPPSANVYWRYTATGVYVSTDAQNYKAGARLKAQYEGMTPANGDVAMYVHVYRAAKRGDLDNYAKVLGDALNGVAYHDDSQVVELHMYRHDDKNNPRVEVEVRRVQP